MKQIGNYVGISLLTVGRNLTRETPYTMAQDLDSYLIWSQDTGEIVWVGEEGVVGAEGYKIAWEQLCWRNGGDVYLEAHRARLST
jgi:hypothetical protein